LINGNIVSQCMLHHSLLSRSSWILIWYVIMGYSRFSELLMFQWSSSQRNARRSWLIFGRTRRSREGSRKRHRSWWRRHLRRLRSFTRSRIRGPILMGTLRSYARIWNYQHYLKRCQFFLNEGILLLSYFYCGIFHYSILHSWKKFRIRMDYMCFRCWSRDINYFWIFRNESCCLCKW
jgi:hypothetical protein